jgi:hypothetical protein
VPGHEDVANLMILNKIMTKPGSDFEKEGGFKVHAMHYIYTNFV